jgi:hypothetical protein
MRALSGISPASDRKSAASQDRFHDDQKTDSRVQGRYLIAERSGALGVSHLLHSVIEVRK